MRIDTPLTTDLGLGVDRRIIDPSDSVVDIESKVAANVPIMTVTQYGSLVSTSKLTSSGLVSAEANFTNTGAAPDTLLVTLTKGLWTIYPSLWYTADIATAMAQTQRVLFKAVDSISGGAGVLGMIGLLTGVQGFNPTFNPWRLLMRNDWTLKMDVPATAVGDKLFLWLAFNCVKEL